MRDERSNKESMIAALADGSLPGPERDQQMALVARSVELSEALAVQQRAIELVRSVEVAAPSALHRSVGALINSPRRATNRGRTRLAALGALGAAATAVLVIFLVALNMPGSSPPTLKQISALTFDRPTLAAAVQSTTDHGELAISVQGVAFPYYEHFGWRASGTRIDKVSGRSVTTVFYESPAGRHIGYAIVSGSALKVSAGRLVTRGGAPFRVIVSGPTTIVAWQRYGHLCVISGHRVSATTLLRLASWTEPRSV